MQRVEINEEPATAEQLYRAATVNYGHFTSMQVRGGAVRGLELHLARLLGATGELYDQYLDPLDVRDLILHALGEETDASVRATVFGLREPELMITVTDPVPDAPDLGWRIRTVEHTRDLPHIKHVATMGLVHRWRQAVADGFDDALFVNQDGLVGEGTAWNLALWDGEGFVWQQADQLNGITKQLLRAALPKSTERPVRLDELGSFSGAVATYSHCPAQPLTNVDDVYFPASKEAVEVMLAAWETVAWEPLYLP